MWMLPKSHENQFCWFVRYSAHELITTSSTIQQLKGRPGPILDVAPFNFLWWHPQIDVDPSVVSLGKLYFNSMFTELFIDLWLTLYILIYIYHNMFFGAWCPKKCEHWVGEKWMKSWGNHDTSRPIQSIRSTLHFVDIYVINIDSYTCFMYFYS